MIKQTLYFGNPAYLSVRRRQLEIRLPAETKSDATAESRRAAAKSVPIEDIGLVVVDNKQVTMTQSVLSSLLENNAAVVVCDDRRMPTGLFLPLESNTTQSERFRNQIEASLPLRKQLWAQTVSAKIANQAAVLRQVRGEECGNMDAWAQQVRSGDPENLEARAAAFYWRALFGHLDGFGRNRMGPPPNNLLNYGYAIVRAVVARSLVGSGLLPTLGIHHRNRYNAYCLADDIMEPYRPYVDLLVAQIVDGGRDISELTTELKAEMLRLPIVDVTICGRRSPLMVAATTTTASLQRCYSGETRKISYPAI